MSKTTSEKILEVAAGEIGYHEGTGKLNKYGAWFGMDGVAWCMEFVQWVYAQAGSPLPHKTPSCGSLLSWYRENQPDCVSSVPTPGCIVIFDFPGTKYRTDHTGIFVQLNGESITTIDGNTDGVNESNGGWVRRRTRSLDYANPVYIIPRELGDREEDDMQRYNTMKEISDGAPWATETVAKLIEHGTIRGSGLTDTQGRPADMNLSEDMLRVLVWNDREGLYG